MIFSDSLPSIESNVKLMAGQEFVEEDVVIDRTRIGTDPVGLVSFGQPSDVFGFDFAIDETFVFRSFDVLGTFALHFELKFERVFVSTLISRVRRFPLKLSWIGF